MPELRACLLMTALLLSACGPSVVGDFEAARRAALRDLGPVPSDWEPDLRVRMSEDTLGRALSTVMEDHGRLREELTLGPLSVVPSLDVTKLAAVDAARSDCEDCLSFEAAVLGQLEIQGLLPIPPVRASGRVTIDAVVQTELSHDDVLVSISPVEVRALELDAGNLALRLGSYLVPGVLQALREQVLEAVPPIPLLRLPADLLPIRASRVESTDRGVQMGFLTTSPSPHPVMAPPRSDSDFVAAISSESLVGILAREAYQAGPVTHGVVPVPTALALIDRTFSLGLRLWRPKGRGWWRDVEVRGTSQIEGTDIQLEAADAVEVAQSKGAAAADPLAAMVEGRILKGIADALSTTVPASHGGSFGKRKAKVKITSLTGKGDAVFLTGSLRFPKPKKR